MKKLVLTLFLVLLFSSQNTFAQTQEPLKAQLTMQDVVVFSNNKNTLFGLKDKSGNIVVDAQYKKLIRLGTSSWIINKKNKYGIMDSSGNILVEPKFRHVDRMMLKYVKLGNENDYGVYDEKGEIILPNEYMTINMLFGGMFLIKKNYKYGVADRNGNIILKPIFDEIYMPKPNIMRIEYNGQWYEIEQIAGGEIELPEDVKNIKENKNFKVTEFVKDPLTASGYSAVTFTDYFLKIFSSISPSHEETIDELMLSQGADTVNIFIKCTWLPKYPFTFAKKYYHNIRTPNNGPLSNVKSDLKKKLD
ncbi:hypothetical protein BHV42_08530 [Candidatus Melainabacteria bacterium MEL.A1]|jgi:hypothetical protein|nr:hypothetical protein BHV42_08530 [Candidatus Melainabacteria bacterium MEL.A1]CCX80264.1 putative uncharacterized protein [Clostridium sp. CAG:715]DAA83919.1 MAG TPA: hypothetical protein CPT82_05220 [Candidatus Gastranaerophilales bacterium HUM_2]